MAIFSVKDLRSLILEGKKQNFKLASRIDAAAMIFVTKKIIEEPVTDINAVDYGSTIYHVESESEDGVFYDVKGQTCTCSDFTKKRAPSGFCKHRVATLILQRSQDLLKTREEQERKAGVRIFED